MLNKIRDNSLILQGYILFKKAYAVESLQVDNIMQNGFYLVPGDEKNMKIFAKGRLRRLEIKNNF